MTTSFLGASLDPGIRAGVVGDPVAHSLSPTIHNAAYRALGLDWRYGAFRVTEQDGAAAIEEASAAGLRGLSVTTPLKVVAARACSDRSDAVRRIGAANTVIFTTGSRRAEITDGDGLLADLDDAWGFDPRGQVCGVIGAGATARSIVASLADRGAEKVLVVNRTEANAIAAAAVAGDRGVVAATGGLADAALVVQAASLSFGRPREADDAVVTALSAALHDGQYVVDVVYHPEVTPFLEAAKRRGARTRNGLGMLVRQAGLQVELFTGQPAPLDAMWEAVLAR